MKRFKFLGIVLLFFVATSIIYASNDMYSQQIKYYNSMKTCTKGVFSLGNSSIDFGGKTFDIGMSYYIYGIKGNKCHIRENLGGVDKTCYLPMAVARKYAEAGMHTLNTSMRNGAAYSNYINQISNDNNYCKYEY